MNPPRFRRPSPALAVSCLALFVALGGTGYAALKLPRHSVGVKQLRKNAVRGSKVKNKSLTGSDLKLRSLGTVPSASKANTATNATHAATADTASKAVTATTAASAVNASKAVDADHAKAADTVGGVTVKGFTYRTPVNGSKATLFSLDGLTLTASCSAGRVDATTSVDNAYISSSWVAKPNTPSGDVDTDFDTADTFLANISTGAKTGSIEYVGPTGQRVSVSLQADMAAACTVSGARCRVRVARARRARGACPGQCGVRPNRPALSGA